MATGAPRLRVLRQFLAAAGPSIPQVAFRSMLVPFLVDAPFFLTSLIAQDRSSLVAGTIACLGLYLLRSRPCAGLQCSSALSLRPSGRARTTVAQRSPAMSTFILLDSNLNLPC